MEYSLTLVLHAAALAAPSDGRLLLLNPVNLTEQVDADDTARIDAALHAALQERPGMTVLRPDGLQHHDGLAEQVARVRPLIRRGEDAYMAFSFAEAAAILHEAAEQLLADLVAADEDTVKLLQRAKLLEGASWAEAKKPEVAAVAFAEALTLMPHAEFDLTILAPKTQALWFQAAARVRARGSSTLSVTSDPAGANVFIDGRPYGVTPAQADELPVGTHHVAVQMAGRQTAHRTITVNGPARVSLPLADSSTRVVIQRIRDTLLDGATPGDTLLQADLRWIRQEFSVSSVVLVGLVNTQAQAQEPPGTWVVLQRWHGGLFKTVALRYERWRELLPQAVDNLAASNPSLLYLPSASQPPFNFERGVFGVDAKLQAVARQGPRVWQDVSVWVGAGTAPLTGFGPWYGGMLATSWGSDIWPLDVQLSGGCSTYTDQAALYNLTVQAGLRRAFNWHPIRLSGGLRLGVAGLFEHVVNQAIRMQVSPTADVVLRLELALASQLFVGLKVSGGVTAIQIVEPTGVHWGFPAQLRGLLGVGWYL